jgi:hypothetical protein
MRVLILFPSKTLLQIYRKPDLLDRYVDAIAYSKAAGAAKNW